MLYKENIKRLKYVSYANFNSKVQHNHHYKDPDTYDVELYKELSVKYQLPYRGCHLITNIRGQSIRLSSDTLVGIKQLAKISLSNSEWLSLYGSIQSNMFLHFAWPVHRVPTINTARYSKFKDRLDLLLVDLSNYYLGKPTLLNNVYNQPLTKLWLDSFESFDNFVKVMKLKPFVNDSMQVINLSTLQAFGNISLSKNLIRKLTSRNNMISYINNAIDLSSSIK